MIPRLKTLYHKEVKTMLKEKYGFKNLNMAPKFEKVVLNMGLGIDGNDSKIFKSCEEDLAKIAGQKPVSTKFKKSISNFKTRKDTKAGLKVTLRKNKMYEFIDRLVNIALPRIKDFRGLSSKGFDKFGNFTFGVKEHIIFPEVNFDKVDKIRGLDITIVIKSISKEHSLELLKKFIFPFRFLLFRISELSKFSNIELFLNIFFRSILDILKLEERKNIQHSITLA